MSKLRNIRNKKIIELRNRGYTYSKIAKLFVISRARVHQICSGYKPGNADLYDRIFLRDNYKCQWGENCNGSNKLIVHHIDFNDRNNDPKNLITLCPACHVYFHKNFHIDSSKEFEIQNRITKICPECEKEFKDYGKRKFCSVKCRQANKFKKIKELRISGFKWREIAKILNQHQQGLMSFYNKKNNL